MIRTPAISILHLLIASILLTGCEILDSTEIQISPDDLQIVSDSTEYVGMRRDPKRVLIDVDVTYTNKSSVNIYLGGCGYVFYDLEQLVDGAWIVRPGFARACYANDHDSIVVQPGESMVIEARTATYGAEYPDQSWARKDVSGTYRISIPAYLKWSYSEQRHSQPVPDTGRYSNTFEVEDRCILSWGGC